MQLILVGALMAACPSGGSGSRDAGVVALTCMVEAPTMCTQTQLRYADVRPIVQQHCVTCHSSTTSGPWPLTSWQDFADWSDLVRDALVRCEMPPRDAGTHFSNDERQLILEWLSCGFPR